MAEVIINGRSCHRHDSNVHSMSHNTSRLPKRMMTIPLICVCVSIYRPAAHVLMTRVLETPKEYRTPGGVSPWVSI